MLPKDTVVTVLFALAQELTSARKSYDLATADADRAAAVANDALVRYAALQRIDASVRALIEVQTALLDVAPVLLTDDAAALAYVPSALGESLKTLVSPAPVSTAVPVVGQVKVK